MKVSVAEAKNKLSRCSMAANACDSSSYRHDDEDMRRIMSRAAAATNAFAYCGVSTKSIISTIFAFAT